MNRLVLTLAVGTLLSVWADAQQNGPILAADRVKMLQNNRGLVEKLVNHSVVLADSNDALKRAASCRDTMNDLAVALDRAILDQDASRIAELGDHLVLIANDGLAPCLAEGRTAYPAGSDPALQLKELHEQAKNELTRLERSVPRDGVLGRSNQVKDTLAKWRDTLEKLK